MRTKMSRLQTDWELVDYLSSCFFQMENQYALCLERRHGRDSNPGLKTVSGRTHLLIPEALAMRHESPDIGGIFFFTLNTFVMLGGRSHVMSKCTTGRPGRLECLLLHGKSC